MEFVSDWEFVLGVPMFSKFRKPARNFSAEEDEIIEKLYRNNSIHELARILCRDEKAINRRAASLGIKKSVEYVKEQRRQAAMLGHKKLKEIRGNKQKTKKAVQT